MKIFALINNYTDDRTNNPIFGDREVAWYEMPDSSILKYPNPFFVPDFDTEFIAFPTIAIRIGRVGKSIARRFAYRYIEAMGAAAAVVAPNCLEHLRKARLPWSAAVSFDRSCLLGNLQPFNTFNNNEVIEFCCGNDKIDYSLQSLRLTPEEVIEFLSVRNTLKNGDLILLGLTPSGLSLKPETKMTARYNTSDTKLLEIKIK